MAAEGPPGSKPPAIYPRSGYGPSDSEDLARVATYHRWYGWFDLVCGLLFLGGGLVAHAMVPDFGGLVFLIAASGIALVYLLWAWLSFAMARWIEERRHHTVLLVVSCLNLMSIPVGTLVGIAAMSLLFRPSVQEAFRIQDRRVV